MNLLSTFVALFLVTDSVGLRILPPTTVTTRRNALAFYGLTSTFFTLPSASFSSPSPTTPPSVEVIVKAPPSFAPPPTTPNSIDSPPALYITCRPNTSDDIPSAILSGTRGRPPPVLSKRVSSPSFPLTVILNSQDATPEGREGDYWYSQPLIVSARWDVDGKAATRGPDDLVGRAVFTPSSPKTTVTLTGRGVTGKFFTSSGGAQ